MKTIQKMVAIVLSVAAVAAAFTGCVTKDTAEKMYQIGIVQLAEHAALDAAYKGFVDGLAEAGYVDGKNIKLNYSNAQGEIANCQTIATKLVNDKPDLILAIATPAAQAAVNATDTIPILVTAVTDPAESALVADNSKPGGNVTGTSDLTPVKEQLELLKDLAPSAKKIGLLYSSSEANSKIQIDIAKQVCGELGLTTEDFTVSSANDLQQVVTSMIGKVDAIYCPTDNMIAVGMPTIGEIASSNNIPVIVGEGDVVKNGGFATYGISYYELGKQTAAQAIRILKDGAKPADMPIEYLENTELFINKGFADKIGVTVPADLLAKATIVE